MNKIGFFLLSIVFLVAMFTACEEDDANAPTPVSDLMAYAGKNRAKVVFRVPLDAVSGKVFYGNGKYNVFSVGDTATVQGIIVPELPEGKQILRLVTFNADGLVSDPKAVNVNVYGDSYQNGLTSRQLINQSTISPTSIQLSFEAADEGEVAVRLVFTNTSGAKDSIMMSNSQTSIVVNDINLNEAYYYYSVFKPEPDAIDEFLTTPVDAKEAAMLNFEKGKWIIAGFSDEEPGGDGQWALANYIIDNNVATFWHSEIVASYAQMPHWITVDMQAEKKFSGFNFIQTQEMGEQGLANGFRFEISNDNSTWTNVMEGEFTTSRYIQPLTFAEPVIARYFKITILNGYNDAFWSQIAEIDLFNEVNVSGENGVEAPTEIPLVNAKQPFQGDGSDLFPAVGAGRMQQVVGWIHNENAYISFDNTVNTLTVFSAAVWGVSDVSNGKIYQTVNLQPGNYTLKIDAGNTTDPACADVYGIVATGETLPDYSVITSASEVLGYSDLIANQLLVNSISFTVTSTSQITLGIVYNTHSIYETLGIPWSDMHINGFELLINNSNSF